MIDQKKAALILPTLNEKQNLTILYKQIRTFSAELPIIIVDDGSTDGTIDIIESLLTQDQNIQYLQRFSRLGIGSAHLDGLKIAVEIGCSHGLTMDADLTHKVEDAERMLQLKTDVDVLIGSRYLSKNNMNNWTLTRKVLTRLGHFTTAIFFKESYDMSSGLRLYKLKNLDLNFLRTKCPTDYSFFFVSLLTLKKRGASIGEISVTLDPRQSGNSKMNLAMVYRGVKMLILYGFRIRKI